MINCKYGKVNAQVENAAGVSGILIRSGAQYVFRVPTSDGSQEFTDYELRHDDLSVTIDAEGCGQNIMFWFS